MSGVKGKSGRKPGIKNITQYLYKEIDNNWQELVDALLEKATNGDREALFYCFDRRIGKVKTDIYPVNETARLLVKLTRRTTLSESDIATIQQLGYEISLVNVSTRKWQ